MLMPFGPQTSQDLFAAERDTVRPLRQDRWLPMVGLSGSWVFHRKT